MGTAQAVYQQCQRIARFPTQRRVVVQYQSVAVGQSDEMALVRQRAVWPRHEGAKHRLNVRIAEKRQRGKIEVCRFDVRGDERWAEHRAVLNIVDLLRSLGDRS